MNSYLHNLNETLALLILVAGFKASTFNFIQLSDAQIAFIRGHIFVDKGEDKDDEKSLHPFSSVKSEQLAMKLQSICYMLRA